MTDQPNLNDPNLTLGRYLSWARAQQGLSIRQLEALSGVRRSAIVRLEQNEVEQPSADSLVRIAQTLELNETDVLLLAGITVPKQNASLDVMLRTEYNLSGDAVREAKRDIEAIVAKYRMQPRSSSNEITTSRRRRETNGQQTNEHY